MRPAAVLLQSMLLPALQRLALLAAFAVGGVPAPAVASLARRRRAEARRRASAARAEIAHPPRQRVA